MLVSVAPATLHTSGDRFVLVVLVSLSTLMAACSGDAFTTASDADAGPGGAGGESGSGGQATGGRAGTGGRGTGGRVGTGGASGGTPGSGGAPSGGAGGSGGTIAAGGASTGGLGGVPTGGTGGSPAGGMGGLSSGGTGGAAGSGGAGGTGSGVCDPASATAMCDQCIQAKCCAEYLACDSGCSSELTCYTTCFIGVGDPALCASDCANQSGVLEPSTSALVSCIQVQEGTNQRCSIPCYGYNVP